MSSKIIPSNWEETGDLGCEGGGFLACGTDFIHYDSSTTESIQITVSARN